MLNDLLLVYFEHLFMFYVPEGQEHKRGNILLQNATKDILDDLLKIYKPSVNLFGLGRITKLARLYDKLAKEKDLNSKKSHKIINEINDEFCKLIYSIEMKEFMELFNLQRKDFKINDIEFYYKDKLIYVGTDISKKNFQSISSEYFRDIIDTDDEFLGELVYNYFCEWYNMIQKEPNLIMKPNWFLYKTKPRYELGFLNSRHDNGSVIYMFKKGY